MAEVKWIKLVSDMFDNRKIKQIRKMPDGDAIIVIWFQILCLAGNQGNKGLVYFSENIPYTDEMLSVEFDRNLNTIRLAMSTFIKFEMIEVVNDFILISNWERYQSADKIESLREYNRDKKREQRIKQKLLLNDKCQGQVLGQVQGHVNECQDTDILSISNSVSLSSSLKENNNKDDVFKEYSNDNEDLHKALLDFEDMRKKLRKPMTNRAKELLVNKLDKLSSYDPIELLNQSIMNGWLDIYEPKKQNKEKSILERIENL